MSGAFVSKLTNVLSLINEHGRDMTYRRKLLIDNPDAPWEPSVGYSTTSLKGVWNFTRQTTVIGGEVKREDDQITIKYDDLGFEPQNGDEVLDSLYTYTVTGSQIVKPGNIPIIILLEVKR